MAKSFVLSDESINSYGFWLLTEGGVLDQFKKNPVMLWMHCRAWRGTTDEVLPIGYWENIRVEGKKVLADPVFDEKDEFALKIKQKVEAGVIRMASVGIKILTTTGDRLYLKKGQTRETALKWVLREASIVDIGSNDNAIAFYDEEDILLELSDGETSKIPVKLLNNNLDEMEVEKFEFKEAATTLGLSDNATRVELLQGIQTLVNENKKLKDEKEAREEKEAGERKAEAARLVDEAIKDGRLNASARESYRTLFEKDHEAALASLSAIPKRDTVHDKLDGEGKKETSLLDKSWDELDKAGKLAELRDKHPGAYKEKFREQFGKEPRM